MMSAKYCHSETGDVICDIDNFTYGPRSRQELHNALSLEQISIHHVLSNWDYRHLSTRFVPPSIMNKIATFDNFLRSWIVVDVKAAIKRKDGLASTSQEQFDYGFNHMIFPNLHEVIHIENFHYGLTVTARDHNITSGLNWDIMWGDWTYRPIETNRKIFTGFVQDKYKEESIISEEIWRLRSYCSSCSMFTEKYVLGKKQTLSIKNEHLIWTCSEPIYFSEDMRNENEEFYQDLITTWTCRARKQYNIFSITK